MTGLQEIDEWFGEWWLEHTTRHRFFPWAAADSQAESVEVGDWKARLIRNGFDRRIADDSSRLMLDRETSWEKFTKEFVKVGHELCKARNEAVMGTVGPAAPATIEAAWANSKDCQDCSGGGMAARYRHNPAGDGKGRGAVGFRVMLYCLCPLGRALKRNHEGRPDGPCLPDLAKFPALQVRPCGNGTLDNPYRYRLGEWVDLNDEPISVSRDWRHDRKGVTRSVREILKQRPAPVAMPAPPVFQAIETSAIY